MKKIILILTILMLMPFTLAQETITENSVNPDSPLWGIDIAMEKIQLALAGKEQKVNLGLQFALERLQEIKERKENKEAIAKANKRRNELMVDVESDVEEVDDEEVKRELRQKIQENSERQIIHLTDILDKVPEQAKAGITRAIENQEKQKIRIEEKSRLVGNLPRDNNRI